MTSLFALAALSALLSAGEAKAHDPCEARDDGWIEARLRAGGRVDALLAAAAEHRLQILVTEVVPGVDGRRALVSHGYRLGAEYYYPASAIKTFASVAALRALARLPAAADGARADLRTPLALCSPGAQRCTRTRDASNRDGQRITIGHEIRKMQIVSDNAAFNRLYDFVGHREINEDLRGLGFASLRIHHRLSSAEPPGQYRRTPAAELRLGKRRWAVPERDSDLVLAPHPAGATAIGSGHLVGREVVAQPLDFADKNGVALCELQRVNLALVLPERGPELGLAAADREFLLAAMTVDPEGSDNPVFTDPAQAAARFKPLLAGLLRAVPRSRVRYVNKAGKAYGFHVENAYLEDRETGRGFFITATVYANSDGVLDDDRYDYAEVTAPFYEALGELLARAWLAAPARAVPG